MTPTVDKGVVTGLAFVTDNVTDISPVPVFVGLKSLSCSGSGSGKGKLLNLLPVQGMKLTSMSCSRTKVSDLSPLQGMPLTYLGCSSTQVSDLSPLQGMNLTEIYVYAQEHYQRVGHNPPNEEPQDNRD